MKKMKKLLSLVLAVVMVIGLLPMKSFATEKDAVYIGLVESGVIPKWSLMIFTPAGVFLIVLAVYGIYYGVNAWLKARAESVEISQGGVLAEAAVSQDGVEELPQEERGI